MTTGLIRGAWTEPAADWGIDGCLTCHVPVEGDFQDYMRLVREAGVKWVRERGAWIDETARTDGQDQLVSRLRTMQAAGLHVVAFAGSPVVHAEQPGNQLPEDLQAVYAASFRQGRNAAGLVDAWEMPGEPDVGYCRDLPDRLAAYNKAMYLGLHDGAAAAGRSTMVLMGALGQAPGPWLKRAMRNGLLDYTDAYNFHFYGHASDLQGVISAHAAVVRAAFPSTGPAARHGRPGAPVSGTRVAGSRLALPLWITECGMDAMAPGDFYNPQRRALQAAFTRETADEAGSAREVAMFMPFILVHRDDPHAMTVRGDFPLPAWTAYADHVRANAWADRPLARGSTEPNRVVVQWLPDNASTVPHKVSGTYRFLKEAAVRGVLRVYNFGGTPVRGWLDAGVLSNVGMESALFVPDGKGRMKSDEKTVPAGGRIDLPLVFRPRGDGYFRDEFSAFFRDASGGNSPIGFGLERWPEAEDFAETELVLKPMGGKFLLTEDTIQAKAVGSWTPMNGVRVEEAAGAGAVFQVERILDDPLRPEQAVAGLDGLPAKGFVRLQLSRPMASGAAVRVDLVDGKGQRFAIWENLGMNYVRPSSDVWLNLADFNLFFWGRCSADAQLHPEQIREVQLRFYFRKAHDPVEARLSFMSAVQKPATATNH